MHGVTHLIIYYSHFMHDNKIHLFSRYIIWYLSIDIIIYVLWDCNDLAITFLA